VDDYYILCTNFINSFFLLITKESQRFKRLKKDRTDTEEESSGMSDKDEFVCGYKGMVLHQLWRFITRKCIKNDQF